MPPYIVDFYCAEWRVAVEVDGDSHDADDRRHADERRAEALRRMGVQVLGVPAHAIGDRLDAVVAWISRLRHAASPQGCTPS